VWILYQLLWVSQFCPNWGPEAHIRRPISTGVGLKVLFRDHLQVFSQSDDVEWRPDAQTRSPNVRWKPDKPGFPKKSNLDDPTPVWSAWLGLTEKQLLAGARVARWRPCRFRRIHFGPHSALGECTSARMPSSRMVPISAELTVFVTDWHTERTLAEHIPKLQQPYPFKVQSRTPTRMAKLEKRTIMIE
jgi:hypothetical protein